MTDREMLELAARAADYEVRPDGEGGLTISTGGRRCRDWTRRAGLAQPENRPCTCHPDDNPPQPCAQRYALTECKAPAQAEIVRQMEKKT